MTADKHQAEHARLQDRLRRVQSATRLLEAQQAFTDVVMADQYMTPEQKVAILQALYAAMPSNEEYDAAPWQPGLRPDGTPL